MSIQEREITLPSGVKVKINYPTPKINPISPEIPDAEIEIIRIDFFVSSGGVTVNKLGKGLYGNLFVVNGETKPAGFDLEAALSWCRSHGWTVRTWPGGARAWKNGLEPVRTSTEIIKLRDRMRLNPRPELEGAGVRLDLAYDL